MSKQQLSNQAYLIIHVWFESRQPADIKLIREKQERADVISKD